jgi:hypothetical protein
MSLAGHFSGFLPTIYYEQSKTIFTGYNEFGGDWLIEYTVA